MYEDLPGAGTVELAEKDRLPRPEDELTTGDARYHRASHQGGFNVGVRIAFGMAVSPVPRCEPLEGSKDIPGHGRVSILVDRNRRRCVRHENNADAFPQSRFSQCLSYVGSDIDHFRPRPALYREPPHSFPSLP